MNVIQTRVPRLRFSHLGLCTTDLPKMENFYTRVLGFVVTDRGHALGLDLVFLSRDPNEHHQIVLGTGRPRELPANTANPMFGPCINQVSLALESLDDLRAMNTHLTKHYPTFEPIYANHGTAWSIYFYDPERNFIETFVDTEWYCQQPVFEPLDLALSNMEILKQTEALARAGAGFQMAAVWRAEIKRKMDAVTA
jgi:catechol 2,3-dioxygenase